MLFATMWPVLPLSLQEAEWNGHACLSTGPATTGLEAYSTAAGHKLEEGEDIWRLTV